MCQHSLFDIIQQGLLESVHLVLLNAIDEERVVAALAQLHLDVHELGHRRALQRLHEEAVVVLEDGTIVTTCDGQEFKSEFVFKERTWPRKCTISFQARAFQGPGDSEPVAMFYKGYFKRSILNSKVILIRGKVYKLSGQMFFKQQVKTGKFKATKRRYR